MNYLRISGNVMETSLDVISFENDGSRVMYSPALDLSGCGKTLKEARSSFEIIFEEYIRYAMENNTLDEDLVSRGWVKENTKKDVMVPPILTDLIIRDSNLQSVINQKSFRKTHLRFGSFADTY